MVIMRKIIKKGDAIVFLLLTLFIFVSCTNTLKVTYNEINSLTRSAAPFIEGSYEKEIENSEFEKLTGINLPDSVPKDFTNERKVYVVSHDKNNKILNISIMIGENNDGYPISIAMYSRKIWSDLSYSPIDYRYGDKDNNKMTKTNISDVPVCFIHYVDNNSEYKLGYDIYMAEFNINDINIYIESNRLNQADFESFVNTLISKAHSLE